MVQAIGQKAPSPAAANLTERLIGEPILGYFAYGMLRPAPGVQQGVTMMPRVLVGARTNDDDAASEPLALGAAPGAAGMPALHRGAEAADGRGPMRACRTLFLTQGSLTRNLFADVDEEAEEGYSFEAATQGWRGDGALLLMRLYAAVVAAAKAAMEHFALQDGATVVSAKAVAAQHLAQQCEAFGVPQPALAQQMRFSLWECDHLNNVQPAATRGSRRLKVLRLAVKDVHDKSGALLGAVAYADTFLEVPALGGRPALLLNLTERLPAVTAFSALGQEAAAAARAARSFARLAATSPALALASGERAAAARAARRKQVEQRAAATAAQAAAVKLKKASVAAHAEAGGHDQLHSDDAEVDEGAQEEDEDGDVGGDDVETSVPAAVEQLSDGGPLGRMLTLGGGEEVMLATGAPACPFVPGTVWGFTAGLVFIAHHTPTLWALPFEAQLEAVTVQDLGAGLGETVVLRGHDPCCGLPPACHLTTNRHVALVLGSMTQTGRRHMLSTVLPAWSQTCKEGITVPDRGEVVPGGSILYHR